jgi:hypothetical protein
LAAGRWSGPGAFGGWAGSDAGLDIAGQPAAVQRFRQLIGTMATVVQPAQA